MRLIFDLFGSQTDSRFRGIGRYTLSLAKAMAAQAGEHDMRLLANGLYLDSVAQFRNEFAGLVPRGAYASYTHPPMDTRNTDDPVQEKIASALIHTGYQSVGADVMLCASPFEGWCERGVVPQAAGQLPSGLKVAVMHDLIPWLFPEQHLDPVPNYKHWYTRRLAALGQYDLLLANSEATRTDAIRLLNLPPERVVTIFAAADEKFRKLSPEALAATDLRRFGITRPFVLYTGNGDYRKNLGGMLSAFAALPRSVRDAHQLVVNQVGHLELFMMQVASFGLSKEDVVVTGHITDEELLALYNECEVFVFPSLYEGFGLPVLEAMSCGAAVIAGNNSSIPEVAGRVDLLFDASSVQAISSKLLQALTDKAWQAELRKYGLERAAQFSWEKSAHTAWRAIEAAHQARETAKSAQLASQALPRPRVAAVLALPPGPAFDRAASLVAALSPYADIELVTENDNGSPSSAATLSRSALPQQWNRFDTVLYLSATGSLSPALISLIRSAPGVLVLHDTGGHRTALPRAGFPASEAEVNLVLRDEGLQGLVALHRGQDNRTGSAAPLSRSLLEALRCLVLEDSSLAATLRQALAPAELPAMVVLDQQGESAPASWATQVAAALHTGAAKNWRGAAAHIAAAWRGRGHDDAALNDVAQHAERNLRLNRGARILVDVTQLARTDAMSGIQRVVRNIAREMCLLEGSLTPIELVQLRDGALYRASDIIGSIFEFGTNACPAEQIDIQPGDTLFMIDSSWEQYPEFLPTFDIIRQFGGRIVTVIYDLIPLRLPQYCSAGLVRVFQRWFGIAVKQSDMLLCISRAVRDDVNAYISEHRLERDPAQRVEYWHLGADILPLAEHDTVRPAVTAMLADTAHPLFLMVGTIEPRKGHAVVLDAFEALWAAGSQVRLCWAGKEGWEVDALMTRLRNHPEMGRRLHFVERFTDAEINLCYAHAHALIAASVAEGYGLPIVEAAQHQVPVLASDIPVFREVGGDGARYFRLGDQAALMEAVLAFSQLGSAERRTMAAMVPVLTWKESAAWTLRLLEAAFDRPGGDKQRGNPGSGSTARSR